MNIQELELDLIDVADRLRSVNPEYVHEIAVSFAEKGQLTPIEVREAGKTGRHRLVFGAHRVAAARELGWKKITCALFRGTIAEARLREIDENLIRRELTALDRSAFLAERERLWVEANPESAQGTAGAVARWHATETISFASDAAEKLGVTERTVRNWLELARVVQGLSPEARDRIAGSRLADKPSELVAIANYCPGRPEEQMAVLDLLFGEGGDRPKNVGAAVNRVRGVDKLKTAKTPQEKCFATLVATWDKATDSTRDEFLRHIEAVKKAKSGGKRPKAG